ncbi:MAG: HD-GYP domain-containing protein [Actinobacteria bacterium]|nr:HD-GYP domain-containing protein [Actinomycetota bacterium]
MATLTALSFAVEERDPFARGHALRVAVLAHSLASRAELDRDRIARLRTGAVLHDIGKLAVPREVLLKKGPLDEIEFMQIRRHPMAGARMLRALGAALEAVPCVLFHHERWDGTGYPSGRGRDDIPLEARILAVADSFDAMTSDRPYRPACDAETALEELKRCAGTQFDPDLVEAFIAACYEGDLGWGNAVAV